MATSYTHELLSDAPILIFTVNETYNIDEHLVESDAEAIRILDEQSEAVVLIDNLLDLDFDFTEILSGASQVSRGINPVYHHLNLKKLIVVTTNPTVIAIYQGMDSEPFGYVKAHIVSTLKEALEDARASV